MADILHLLEQLQNFFGEKISNHKIYLGQLTIEVPSSSLREVFLKLRDEENFHFEMLMDVCGVDYLTYGCDEWETESTTFTGFSRGVTQSTPVQPTSKPLARFAVVYQLLSLKNNQRLRVRVYVTDDPPLLDSVIDIWQSANWYEREAFDLYGILFKGHPDLRRLLTDYGFVGHPFRKDFPLIGTVEMRYDAQLQRCVYEPVSIQPRTLVPKVIRDDNRYLQENEEKIDG